MSELRINPLLLALVVAFGVATSLGAQETDTVTYSVGDGGRHRITGQVVDFNGRELILETASGQRRVPTAHVVDVATRQGERHLAADEAFAAGRIIEAEALYRQAMAAETRLWVRRRIIAQSVRCYRWLGQEAQAGENFLLLVRDDPDTQYFDEIPLRWLPRQPAAELEQAARAWFDRKEPAAKLLGASYLLAGPHRTAAERELRQLAEGDDRRVAALARAQTWRSALATAESARMDKWLVSAEDLPELLQSGPFFVIGQGRLQRQQWTEAALSLLRAALVESDDRALLAQSLLDAGRALGQLGDAKAAARLYREVLGRHSDDRRATAEAKMRLKDFGQAPEPLVVSAPTSPNDTGEPRFLDALRARGLMRLDEAYCRSMLQRADLADARRATLAIELSRALSEQAVASPPLERDVLWDLAEREVETFLQKHPQSPQLPLVQLQAALTLLARGELAAHEASLTGGDPARVEQARVRLREAIKRLDTLSQTVAEANRESDERRSRDEAITAAQRLALERNIAYELSRAYRALALCYSVGTNDHSYALLEAVKRLEPLARLEMGQPLRDASRIGLVVCYRLLSQYAAADRMIAAMLEERPDAATVLRLRAEQIRLALAAGKPADAAKLVAEGRELSGVTSPELDIAWLETHLAHYQAAVKANDTGATEKWGKAADAMVHMIEMAHGPVWQRRAEMLMAAAALAGPGGDDLAMQTRVAENAYRSGRFDEAIEAYDRAQASAERQQNPAAAFDLGFTAATIEHERQRHASARDRYRAIALRYPTNARAAEAHLLAITHAAALVAEPGDCPNFRNETQGDGTKMGLSPLPAAPSPAAPADMVKPYVDLLGEHLRAWKSGATADEANKRLGRIHEFKRDWIGAVAAYQSVGRSDPEFLAALEGVARCGESWLAEQQAAGKPTDAAGRNAAQWFEAVAKGGRATWPKPFGPIERYAALTAARLWMNYTDRGYEPAADALRAALAGATDAPESWRFAAELQLVCALAGGGHRTEAADWLDRAAAGPSDQLMALLAGLGRVAGGSRPEVRGEVAAIQLRTIALLEPRRAAFDAPTVRQLDRLRAQALADAGRRDEALQAYQSLLKSDPRDLAAQEGYARLLTVLGDRASLTLALRTWGELQRNCREGSDPWLRAQVSMASLELQLGDRPQAARRLKLIERLHPGAGSVELRSEIQSLLRRCQ